MNSAGPLPLVTIVTPSYNQGRFIRATIESVLSQNYPRLEYIVMDGGSTDETAAVAAEYAGRLEFISEKDRGQSHAINKGFQRARGEIVAWLNSDDTFTAGAISRAVEALREHPEAAAVYGEGYLMDEAGNVTCRFPHTQPFDLFRLIHISDYVLQQTLFFRRDAVAEAGWVREDLHYAMDWDLLIRLGKSRPLVYVPAYLGCLREYGAAKSFSGGRRRIAEIASMLREHSGRRWPPGVLLYGMDTWAGLARERVRRWSPPLPASWADRLEVAVTHLLYFGMSLVVHPPQRGWDPDGYCAPLVKLELPSGEGTLVLEGEVPDVKRLRDQAVRVRVNGAAGPWLPLEGAFRLELPVTGMAREQCLLVEVGARRRMSPGKHVPGSGRDYRIVSYRLRRLLWDGVEYLPGGAFRVH